MTSDAKIGLLLGLIFIFIIAFILNGLPGVNSRSTSLELARELEDLERSTRVEDLTAPDYMSYRETVSAGANEVRYVAELPGAGASDVAEPQVSQIEQIVAQVRGAEPVAAAANATVPTGSSSATTVSRAEPAPARSSSAGAREYTLAPGDSLAKVAVMFYGPQEGNRLVNIDRIFEANREVLESKDRVMVGTTIVIPPLPDPGSLARSNPQSFQAVSGVSERTPAASGREYVVRSGDSLWTIAQRQLGDGNRYVELRKLNDDVLEDSNRLQVGMRLRLP